MKQIVMILATLFTVLTVIAQSAGTGSIEGFITTPDGKAVANVNVSIKGLKKHVITDEKGKFAFTDIPFGKYILVYSFENEVSQEIPVTVPPEKNDAASYNLALNGRELKEVIVRIGGSINQGTASIGRSGIPIMDLPQAVTIIGQSIIENQQAQRLSDVIKNVNGVYLGGARASTQETFYARGYSLGNTNTFKNGFRVNSGAMPEMNAIESVEVLKGGAALLYGNVAPGGIINMVTKKPKFVFGGEVNMRVGSYDLYKPAVDIYGPINKSIAYRVNGTYEKANSFRNHVHSERFYVNPSLLFKLSEKTKLLVQGDYLQHEFTPDFGIGTMSDKASVYGGKKITPVSRNTFFGAPWQYAKTTQATASFELTHQLNNNWELNALGGYQNYERDYFSTERVQADVNGKWRRPLGKTNNKQDYYTGQIFVNGNLTTGSIGHKILAGADYENDKANNLTSAYSSTSYYDTINLITPSAYQARTDMPTDWKWNTLAQIPVTRFGAYVQDLISLSEKFKLLAGLRWSFQQTDPTKTTYLQSKSKDSVGYSTIQIAKAFSPRVGLVYQPTMHTSLFASYSNSFSPNTGQDIYGNGLKPSIIDQFELGVKNDFFDGLLSANLTLYRIVNNNLSQVALKDKDGNDNNNTNLRELTGQTTSDGIEVDLKSHPLKGWDVLAGYSYNNIRYTKTTGKAGSFVEGQRLVNNP
ncbi:MAG TPA: TonB-dependent receptor, partial [Niabella sp.]|nr:TonB-dependent receptor [Niabella sp.]